MNEILTKTLAQIVNENHQAASVLEKYKLDFCCSGKRSLQKACEENNLHAGTIAEELYAVINEGQTPALDFDKLSLSALADYIVATHHAYTKQALPQIFTYLQKISSKHGDRHHELYRILQNFAILKGEMEMHMGKEELILFPRIKEIENSKNHFDQWSMNIQTPLTVMEDEHEHAGRLLQEIRQYSNDYTPPADACTTYRLSFAALETLEADMHQHVHLENNILFPKTLELAGQKN